MPAPYWDPNISWTTSYKTCMPNCTVNVWGRGTDMGLDMPYGFAWYHDFTENGWSVVSVSQAQPGDVVQYNGSIAIVISGSGNSATCSHSLFTTVTGSAHNFPLDPVTQRPVGPMERYSSDTTDGVKWDSKDNIWNICRQNWIGRCEYEHNINNPGYGLGTPLKVFRSGGHVDPQPDPQPGDSWHWEDTTWTIEETSVESISIPLTTIYECGKFTVDSGDQDNPKAPVHMTDQTDRENQRWEPFNMYTYERNLTYKEDTSQLWSGWDMKYQGSENFPLGNQPSMNNGWQIDWEN